MAKKTKSTFEDELERLEEIVRTLGEEDVSLDRSLSLFEEGVKIARSALDKLNKGEEKVQQLIKDNNGVFSLKDFEIE